MLWEDSSPGLLGYDAVLSCGRIPTFQRCMPQNSHRYGKIIMN